HASLWTAYTNTDLYVAVRVLDSDYVFVPNAPRVGDSDAISLCFDGDRTPNDFSVLQNAFQGNPEGFHIQANEQQNLSIGVDNNAWTAKFGRTRDGYIAEFKIPLSLIDTLDGPGVRSATAGSTIGFEMSITDVDRDRSNAFTSVMCRTSAYRAGESAWVVKLHLGAVELQADHRSNAPLLDGEVSPGEYGAGLEIGFAHGLNPGWMSHGAVQGTGDLRAQLFTVYSDLDLFVSVRVLDDTVLATNRFDDWVYLCFDGDRVGNDFLPDSQVVRKGNPEGFQVGANV